MNRLRSAPFTDDDRDLLTMTERWVDHPIALLPINRFRSVFPDISEKDAVRVTEAGLCLGRAMTLLYWSERQERSTLDRPMALGAMHLYLTEAQRLFGAVFPEGHAFWARFYSRLSAHIQYKIDPDPGQIKRQYALFFLPVDAFHALSKESHQLEYELLIQSLGSVMMAVFAKEATSDCQAHLNQALRLAHRLGLHAYDAWISDLLLNVKKIPS